MAAFKALNDRLVRDAAAPASVPDGGGVKSEVASLIFIQPR